MFSNEITSVIPMYISSQPSPTSFSLLVLISVYFLSVLICPLQFVKLFVKTNKITKWNNIFEDCVSAAFHYSASYNKYLPCPQVVMLMDYLYFAICFSKYRFRIPSEVRKNPLTLLFLARENKILKSP